MTQSTDLVVIPKEPWNRLVRAIAPYLSTDEAVREAFVAIAQTYENVGHSDGYRPEDISVDENQWHGTPFARAPEQVDEHEADNPQGVWCCQKHRDEFKARQEHRKGKH